MKNEKDNTAKRFSTGGLTAGVIVIIIGIMNLFTDALVIYAAIPWIAAGIAILIRSFRPPIGIVKVVLIFFGVFIICVMIPTIPMSFRFDGRGADAEAMGRISGGFILLGLGIFLLWIGFKGPEEANLTDTPKECPLCNKSQHMNRANELYGNRVCRKCYYGFASRRLIAFAIDYGIIVGLFAIVSVLGIIGEFALSFSFLIAILIKDGFRGYSPGKAMLGLRVINEYSGKPVGLWRSFKRNLPVLLPIAPVVIGVQLCKGGRTGDGWSQSKVIWKKYSSCPLFHSKSSDDFIWTKKIKEQEAEKAYSKAIAVEIKGDWNKAIALFDQIISDFPETQSGIDAVISLKSLKEKTRNSYPRRKKD